MRWGSPMSLGSMTSLAAASLWRASLWPTAWGASGYYYTALDNSRRTSNGTENNPAHPTWGSVGQRQLRSVTRASYADRVSKPPGEDRPTPREILSGVFLSTPPSNSTISALFVGWGLLVGYDLVLNRDNASEPLDIACGDASLADGWCPRGLSSRPISFYRSQSEIDAEGDGTRSPINYATSYIDLDWLYGRDKESAAALRTLNAGNMNLTTAELPHLRPDGTWLVADQRPTRMPVTFALMTLLLREHNRCCNEMASAWNADTDEDAYQACRQWTIAVFQHISENEFSERLIGGSARYLGSAAYNCFNDNGKVNNTVNARQQTHRLSAMETIVWSRYLARRSGPYDVRTNAGVDVVFSTVANPAFYSALPSTVGLLDDNYKIIHEHGIELATASADVAGLVERIGGIESIVRGAAYSRSQIVGVSLMSTASPSSFNQPIEAIQRGRDHGVPSYNDVRQACGFSRVTTFQDITSDNRTQQRLADTYGDVELLDAYTGALAENEDGSELFGGPLLRAVFLEQMYRAIVGDRHYHSHNSQNEDAQLSTLRGLILDNSLVSSIPLDAFTATDTVVSPTSCSTKHKEVYLAEGFKVAWTGLEHNKDELMHITISAKGIDVQGMIAIGFGGEDMASTKDFVICDVSSRNSAICTDRSGAEAHGEPPFDGESNDELDVVGIAIEGEWTGVTFARWGVGDDDSDYNLTSDILSGRDTHIVYAWHPGKDIGKHAFNERGGIKLNFANGTMISPCDGPNDYYALHGALLLLAWLVVAPYGIYQARYRKGKTTLLGNLWWEAHEDSMIVCAEALLPLAITAIVTTGGPHSSSHAKWGFYMVGAIVLQILTGWARARALSGKSNNFSPFHRANKHFHIYSGWFAYMAGLAQCYRGLALVSGSDKLVFSPLDFNFSVGTFKIVTTLVFPIWIALVPLIFFILEVRKQSKRYLKKGAANLCGMVELVNEDFSEESLRKDIEDRLMPRTEELPLYTTQEFNDKVLNGRSWVIVDGAVLDVASFVRRHPGGARVLMNVMGTDVTAEIIGEDASIGNSGMTFDPHTHSDIALEIARTLVVGYIEEEDDIETDSSDNDGDDVEASSGVDLGFFDRSLLHARRAFSMSGSDKVGNDSRGLSHTQHRSRRLVRIPVGRDKSRPSGHFASWSGPASSGDEVERRKLFQRGRRSSSRKPRGRRTSGGSSGSGSGSDSFTVDEQKKSISSDGSTEGAHRRKLSVSDGKMKKTSGSMAPAAAAVTLSAKAAAILNAMSPPVTRPELPTRGDIEAEVEEANDAVPFDPVDTSAFELSPATHASPVPDRSRKRPSARSLSLNKPVELNHPVVMHTTSSFNTKPASTDTRPKVNPVRRILGRIGSQLHPIRRSSGHERDVRQEDKPFKAMRRMRENKNLRDFFHVSPLLLHERMGDGGDRPVYKFIFGCRGRAAALVDAMEGVCHFRMRAAKDAGMAVVQRSYNAFAVRLQGEKGTKRRAVPAIETDEGELCIEMRIKLYPDGPMSNLLLQLIKSSDNPAVQLQGPFLQDRLIPPPAHRNVVMIAAGTGVNPMVQMIRDYINPDSHSHGALLGAHSRLVLIWQNHEEGDLFCADELTELQVKAKGLLEVTVIFSGDTTRRNVPGNAFRRAKARLMLKGAGVDLRNKSTGATGDTDAGGTVSGAGDQASSKATPAGVGGNSGSRQQHEGKLGDEHTMGAHSHRHRPARSLSRVTEEDAVSLASSFVNSTRTFGGRDLESGGGSSNFLSPVVLSDSAEEETSTGVDADGDNKDMLWSPILPGKTEKSADDSDRDSNILNGRRLSIAARVADFSSSVWEERKGHDHSRGGGDSPIPLRGGDDGGSRNLFSVALDRERAARNISDSTNDMPGRGPNGAKAHNGRSWEDATRGGTPDVDRSHRARAGGGRWPKRVRRKERTGRDSEGRDDRGGGRPARPTVGRSSSHKVDTIEYSSGEDTDSDASTAAGHPSRLHRPDASNDSSTRSGVNAHPHPTARRKRHESTRIKLSPYNAADSLPGSSLEDSGSGMQPRKISTIVLEKAIGPEVMRAIASVKASGISGAVQDGRADAEDVSPSALDTLVGTKTTGGVLQVVVSGPAGFVFFAEGLLAEMGIPPQAVVLLD